MMRGEIYAPDKVAAMAVLKRLERYGPDGHNCFPRGCCFSDIDGVVELSGQVLLLEVKRSGQEVSRGQAIMYRTLAKFHTVVFKWINPEGAVTHACQVQDGAPIAPEPATEEDLATFFKSWARWAESGATL